MYGPPQAARPTLESREEEFGRCLAAKKVSAIGWSAVEALEKPKSP
ncbi:MAG: hypothetical protein M3122_07635 [Actinomycetota bacterium]|nr:hypothetical protein [Actinomycetota bacterium]